MTLQIDESFLNSPWYVDILYVLFNFNAPPTLSKTKARFIKLKVVRFCILEKVLYWKDIGGILIKCLLKDDADKVMPEFHGGDCGDHIYWKTTANKIMRASFY